MAQKLTLLMFVVFGLLAIQTFDHVACSERDKGNARRPACTKRPCKNHDQCKDPPCSRCSNGPWGSTTCWY
ncbi:unnamed protein product [Ixodes pacificus]